MIPDIDAEVVEQHAREVDFLWSMRDAAARSFVHDLRSLAGADERVEANLDGLRIAGDEGWEVCKVLLSDPDAEAGAVFAAAAVAVERGDLEGIAAVLDLGGEVPGVMRGIVSAFGWISYDRVAPLLDAMLDDESPPDLQWIGLSAAAAHRRDPGAALDNALLSDSAPLRARALRALGELGRIDRIPELRRELASPEEACRFHAAWSAAIFGDTSAANVLWEITSRGGVFAERACDVAMRKMDPPVAHGWLSSLASAPGARARVALAGATALGDPAIVPWLLERAEEPETARAAAAAIALMTGIDLRAERLTTKAPPGAGPSDDPARSNEPVDPDEGLPFPEPTALRRAWESRAPRFKRGVRYLMGRPMEPVWLEEVLRSGRQPARAAAALELSIRTSRRPVFEVRAPAFRQKKDLAGNGRET